MMNEAEGPDDERHLRLELSDSLAVLQQYYGVMAFWKFGKYV